MTIPNDVNRSGPYTADGVATAFNYKFKIYDPTHIQVIVTNLLQQDTILNLTQDYTVTGVGVDGGGQVVCVVPPLAGYLVTLLLNVPFTQEIDLENQGAYYAETVESAFDLSVMRDQQLEERLNRAVTIPPSASPDDLEKLIGNVNRLGDSADDIDTVAAIRDQVVTVSGNSANVTIVAGISANVTKVAGDVANINTVAADKANIDIVAGDVTNINAVAVKIANVNTVAGIAANVTTVAGDVTNINAVAADKANIDLVAADLPNINAVAGDLTNINAIIADKANIDAVAGDLTNLNTVAAKINNVNAVAGIGANVTTVAGIAAQVTTVATNMASVQFFAAVDQGPKASAPTKRNDGTALQSGDLYFDTTRVGMYYYSVSQWLPIAQALAGGVMAGDIDMNGNDLLNVAAGVPDFVDRLILANNPTTPTTKIDISVGSAKGNGKFVANAATYTITLSGVGAGKLDAGALAAGATYHVWALRKQSDRSFAAIASTSATAPVVPSGYDLVIRLGCMIAEAAAATIRACTMSGNKTVLSAAVQEATVAASFARALVTWPSIPNGISVDLLATIICTAAPVVNSSTDVYMTDGNLPPTASTWSIRAMASSATAANSVSGDAVGKVRTNTAKQIYFSATFVVANGTAVGTSMGWEDYQIPRIGA